MVGVLPENFKELFTVIGSETVVKPVGNVPELVFEPISEFSANSVDGFADVDKRADEGYRFDDVIGPGAPGFFGGFDAFDEAKTYRPEEVEASELYAELGDVASDGF